MNLLKRLSILGSVALLSSVPAFAQAAPTPLGFDWGNDLVDWTNKIITSSRRAAGDRGPL